jgi:endonuclease/exonuclease/phosphatase family protein
LRPLRVGWPWLSRSLDGRRRVLGGVCVFTVMSWNVENFFKPKPAERAAYDAKVAALATVITAAAPDLLALQEVGDEESFQALQNLLGGSWSGILSTHFETPHTIRVGWLTPGALSDV